MKNFDIHEINVRLLEKHNYMRRIMRNILTEMGVENIIDTANQMRLCSFFKKVILTWLSQIGLQDLPASP
jgi:membrane protease subunit (stomatin/prohibitin family)